MQNITKASALLPGVSQEHASATWPYSSQYLCWHCCHPFDCVPVFLPIPESARTCGYRLSGNFCSWNCVKAYHFNQCHNRRKSTSVQVISLLAFLTYHRPKYCPTPTSQHMSTCPCLDVYHGLRMALPKESLVGFGGTMTIQEYRQGFWMVECRNWIERVFVGAHIMTSNMDSITATPRLRAFTYEFEVPSYIHSMEKKQQEQEPSRPVVHIKRIKHHTLFG